MSALIAGHSARYLSPTPRARARRNAGKNGSGRTELGSARTDLGVLDRWAGGRRPHYASPEVDVPVALRVDL